MQYLVSVIDDKRNSGSTNRQPAISAFNERLITEGYWVFAGGLAESNAATVIDNRGEQGVPPNPGAWLSTTANRKAIDRIRRENKRDAKQREARMVYDDPPAPLGAIDDDRLG